MTRGAAKATLIGLMVVGSLAMWILAPIGWIYVASKLSSASQVSMSSIVVVIVGIPVTMIVIAKLLGNLNRMYGQLSGQNKPVHVTPPWRRSMRGDRDERAPRTVLDVVMVLSVSVAATLMGIWFLFFAKGGGI